MTHTALNSPGRQRRAVGLILTAAILVSVLVVTAYEGVSGGAKSADIITTTTTTSSGAETGAMIFIQVVNGSTMSPIPGMSVLAGPTSSPNDLTFTPGGPTLSECVHEVLNGAIVSNGTVVANGTTTTFPPCPLKDYVTDTSGWVSIRDVTGAFYFVKAGSVNEWNDIMVGVETNNVVNMTIPLPSGNVTIPWGSVATTQSGNMTGSATSQSMRLSVLWPQTSLVWPCGEGLPNGSTMIPQGVYAGEYVAYSYAALQNGTKVALPEDCPVGGA